MAAGEKKRGVRKGRPVPARLGLQRPPSSTQVTTESRTCLRPNWGRLPLPGTHTKPAHPTALPSWVQSPTRALHVHDPVWRLEGKSPKGMSSAKVRHAMAPRDPELSHPAQLPRCTSAECLCPADTQGDRTWDAVRAEHLALRPHHPR